jgi:hypothetical protein
MDPYTDVISRCLSCGGTYKYPAITYRQKQGLTLNTTTTLLINRCPVCGIDLSICSLHCRRADLERLRPDRIPIEPYDHHQPEERISMATKTVYAFTCDRCGAEETSTTKREQRPMVPRVRDGVGDEPAAAAFDHIDSFFSCPMELCDSCEASYIAWAKTRPPKRRAA